MTTPTPTTTPSATAAATASSGGSVPRLRNGELRAMVARVLADTTGRDLTPGTSAGRGCSRRPPLR